MSAQRVLVAYGSKHCATTASRWSSRPTRTWMTAADSTAWSWAARCMAGRWNNRARRCAERIGEHLHHRWLFSSGPVDSSAEQRD